MAVPRDTCRDFVAASQRHILGNKAAAAASLADCQVLGAEVARRVLASAAAAPAVVAPAVVAPAVVPR